MQRLPVPGRISLFTTAALTLVATISLFMPPASRAASMGHAISEYESGHAPPESCARLRLVATEMRRQRRSLERGYSDNVRQHPALTDRRMPEKQKPRPLS